MTLTTSQMTKVGVGLGLCFAVYKFVNHPAAKAASAGVAGVIIARQVPYLSGALSV